MRTPPYETRLLELLDNRPRQTHSAAPASCIGLVTAVDAKTGRVKLAYQGHGASGNGERIGSDWAPVALPMAGEGRALCVLPKPDDQALVVFLNGDWRAPVVIGFLPSAKDVLPEQIRERKSGGLILGKNGPSVVLDETQGKDRLAVVITDGLGKNRIAIRTDGNTIEITADNIVLDASAGKVSIKAKSIELTSTEDMKLKASGMDVTADQDLNLRGAAHVNIN